MLPRPPDSPLVSLMGGLCRRRSLFALLIVLTGLFHATPARADVSLYGDITDIQTATARMTILAARQSWSFGIGPATWITRDRVDCLLTHLRVGERARSSLVKNPDGSYTALRIDVQTRGVKRLLTGSLSALTTTPPALKVETTTPAPAAETVRFDSATLFLLNGQATPASELRIGDQLAITTVAQPNGETLAVRVDVAAPKKSLQTVTVFGILQAVTGVRWTVRSWRDGAPLTVNVAGVKRPRRDRALVPLTAFQPGDLVLLLGAKTDTSTVDALLMTAQAPDQRFTGVLTALDGSTRLATFAVPGFSAPFSLLLFPATGIRVDGQDAQPGDLRVGDSVEVWGISHTDGPWGAAFLAVNRSP